jgi:lon-related putative ATP-dependent protease
MTNPVPLPLELLYTACDPRAFPFETTSDVEELTEFIGQSRALAAVEFCAGIGHQGYNLFALGPFGTGKHSSVRRVLETKASAKPAPSDWCYVHNFNDPHKPRTLRLPPGRGIQLRDDMVRLLDELKGAIPAAFESDQYRAKAEAIRNDFEQRQQEALRTLGDEAAAHNVALLHSPEGFVFAPTRDDKVLEPAEYEKLPDDEKARIDELVASYQPRLEEMLRSIPKWRREMRAQVRQLNQETTTLAVGHFMDDLCAAYADLPAVMEYLQAVREDVVQNVDSFLKPEQAVVESNGVELFTFHRYRVNLFVDHSTSTGAPIVDDDHPTYNNLIGRVEHIAQMGALVTDFTLIKPGSLHRANGGYLLIDAQKLLTQPFAWESLKRALYGKQVRIESVGQMLSLVPTVSLEPEPIPLDVKVMLFGDRMIYYLLQELDPEFSELFKVAADFDDVMARNDDNVMLYARMIGTLGKREDLLPSHRSAVARVVEHSARMVGDAEKLSTHMQSVVDLLREADYWARQEGVGDIRAKHVEQAIEAAQLRSDRVKCRLQEEILRGTLLVDTEGAAVGQINALSVVEMGGFVFAYPTRVTATTRLGDGDVIDIEREVELSGAIHSKGVMILASFLASRYSRARPLSLSASLVFEQSYGFVEGDSASLAELCAILSDLAQAPIKQSLAVTGSVNQFGQVQAIGGVNEKIEGFFEICKARGLGAEHGVVIPEANVKHLMLKREVRDAVAAGTFGIYAVNTVDDAVELLTGVQAGMPDEQGNLPEGSINYRVATYLYELSVIRQEFAGRASKSHRSKKD